MFMSLKLILILFHFPWDKWACGPYEVCKKTFYQKGLNFPVTVN